MVPIFKATVDEGGTLRFAPSAQAMLRRYVATLRGHAVDVVIRKTRKQRTDRANRYYFGVVVPLIAEHCGYEKDEMHELLAMKFLRIEDDPITGAPRRTRTPDTDTKAFAEYVEACKRFALVELGVYIPEAGEAEAA